MCACAFCLYMCILCMHDIVFVVMIFASECVGMHPTVVLSAVIITLFTTSSMYMPVALLLTSAIYNTQ